MLLNYKDTIQIYSLVQRQLNTGSLQRSRGKAALWFLVYTYSEGYLEEFDSWSTKTHIHMQATDNDLDKVEWSCQISVSRITLQRNFKSQKPK